MFERLLRSTPDERGRLVRVVKPLRRVPGPLRLWRRQLMIPMRIRTVLLAAWACGAYLLAKGVFVSVFWLTVALPTLGSSGSSNFWLLLYGVGFLMLSVSGLVPVVLLIIAGLWAWKGRPITARMMASRGSCASCGHSLLGLVPDADGLTPCPSCQAVWRVGSPEACPTCDYDLTSAPQTAPHDTMICPECGDQWPAPSADRRRYDSVLLHGGVVDDAGVERPRKSDAKRRKASLRSRTRRDRERASLVIFVYWVPAVLCVLLLPWLISTLSEWALGGWLGETAIETISVIGLLVSIGIGVFWLKARVSGVFRRYNLLLDICPACDTDMRGLAVDDAGLAPCPHCHGRWKLPVRPAG